ncbi:MAG: hypothetical protein WBH09_08740 [Rugosibacter sp.]
MLWWSSLFLKIITNEKFIFLLCYAVKNQMSTAEQAACGGQSLVFQGERILSGMSGFNDAADGYRRKMSATKAAIQAKTANRRLVSADFSLWII